MKKTDISIINEKGLKLAATLDMPGSIVKAYAIYAHCFTCSKELKAIANIDKSLADMGIATLRFDMTGIGGSEGNFPDTNFTTQIEDFLSAARYLEQNYEAPKLLMGHSLGGCVALYSALKLPYVKAVTTIAAPSEPSHISIKLKNTREKCFNTGEAETEIGGVKFNFKPQFFEDIERYILKNELPKLNRPYLILHSPVDDYTSIDNAAILFQNAKHPKSFISLDDIDHLMLKEQDAFYVGRLIGTWAEKYLW